MLVHDANIRQKENHRTKYRDTKSRAYLAEIRNEYDKWREENDKLMGPKAVADEADKLVVERRVQLFEKYKDFIDQQKYAEKFDSRSNLHSTVLEEFMYYLFRDLVANFERNALIGKSRTFKDIFFIPPNYKGMTERVHASIERKDHDFVIGTTIEASLYIKNRDEGSVSQSGISEPTGFYRTRIENNVEKHVFDIAAVVIECKTYLDKTMLEGSSRAAEELKARNPNSLYIVVMEWLKLTDAVNLRKYKVEQIYVFRKQKNTDREFRFEPGYAKNPIDPNVVWHLFDTVRTHLTADWESGVQHGLQRGWLL